MKTSTESGGLPMEETLWQFHNAYLQQEDVSEVRETGLTVEGKEYTVSVLIVPPLSYTTCDYFKKTFPHVSDTQIMSQFANWAENSKRKRVRGALLGIEEGEKTKLTFAISATNDHEFLYGRLVEMGTPVETVMQAGVTGIPFHLRDGKTTPAVIKSDYDFKPGVTSKYYDYWEIFRRRDLHSKPVIENLNLGATGIIFVGHHVLTPIAREITGNKRLGEELDIKTDNPLR